MKHARSKILLGLLLAGGWILLTGYVVSTLNDQNRTLQFWDPSDFPITFHMWEEFTSNVESGSNPKRAIQAALDRWAEVTSLSVVLGTDTNTQDAGQDNLNVVTAADTADNRAILPAGVAGLSLKLFVQATGQIIESDIILNPSNTWTTLEPSSSSSAAKNLFDVLLHEFGHSWNLDHTVSRASTMFFSGGGFDFGFNDLAWDDVAGANVVYPMVGLDQITGSIQGEVTRSGSNVFGAFVVAVDENGVLAGSAITMPDGIYEIQHLPPGNYTLYVEPLDGLTTPEDIGGGIFDSAPMVTDFLPAFFGNSMSPSVSVVAGETAFNKNFAVVLGQAAINPDFIATETIVDAFQTFSNRPGRANQGMPTYVAVGGDGVGELRMSDGIFFLGDLTAGAQEASFKLQNNQGFVKVHPVTVLLEAATGPHSIFMNNSSGEVGVISGGLEVFRRFRFLQAYAQFADIPGIRSGLFLINTNVNQPASGNISMRVGEKQASSLGLSPGGRAAITLDSPTIDANGDFQLNPGASLSVKTGTDGQFEGSIRAEADRAIGGTVLFESAFGTTGVGPSRPLYSFLAPIEFKDGGASVRTGLAITNLEARPANVYIQVQGQGGTMDVKGSFVIDLAANSHTAAFIDEFFDEFLPGALPSNFDGSAVVTSNRQIGATVIALRPGVFTTFPIIQNRATSRSFFAQFFHDASLSFFSRLVLINPSPSRTARVTIQIRNTGGSPASVTLSNEGHLSQGKTTLSIPPLGSRVLETQSDVAGSVEIFSEKLDGSPDVPVGGVVLFSGPEVGTAGVGESFPLKEFVIPVDREKAGEAGGIDTGIAILNVQQSSAVTLKLSVRNLDGIEVIAKEITLLPGRRISAFPDQPPFNLSLDPTFKGSLWVSADAEVAAMSLRLSPGVFTTFPVISREHFITPAD